ncbi:MAG TPA: hypothetical protein VNT01_10000, partial [Symbiobacteriaceae bacterium]|nr:hypothetical protein [Symbiobacteriaceae bacterium]
WTLYHTPALSVQPVAAVSGQTVQLPATMMDGAAPVEGAVLTFLVNGAPAGTATTGPDGTGRVSFAVTLPAGSYPISVTSPQSDGLYLRATAGTGTLQVSAQNLTVAYTGSTLVRKPDAATLSATVAPAFAGVPVIFTLTDVVTGQSSSYQAVTDGQGVAVAGISPAPGVYMVTVLPGDPTRYTFGAVSAELVVYDPAGGSAGGGGWFMAGTEKVNFGFQVRYQQGAATGNVSFNNLVGGRHLKESQIDWLVVAGSTAIVQGRTADGYTFRLTVTDGQPDRLAIQVKDAAGSPVVDLQNIEPNGELNVR